MPTLSKALSSLALVVLITACGSAPPPGLPSPEQGARKFLASLARANLLELQGQMASRSLGRVLASRAEQDDDSEAALRAYFFGDATTRLADARVIRIDQESAGDRLVTVTFEYRLERPGLLAAEEFEGERSFELTYVRGGWRVSKLPPVLAPQ